MTHFFNPKNIANAHITYHDVQSLSEKKYVHSTNNDKTALLSFFTIHICTSK